MIAPVLVGFDARAAFLDPRRGFGRVARSLADALLRLLPGQIVLFVPRHAEIPPPWYPLAARVVALARPRRAAFLVDPIAWRWTLARVKVDVLHLPAWGVPPGLTVPVVATGYDATPLRFPSPPAAWPRRRLAMALRSLSRATLVHAISAHAADELASHAGVPRERQRVVLLGVGEPFAPASATPEPYRPHTAPRTPAPQPAVAQPYLLFVGGLDPHKNVALLLAMLRLPGAEVLPPLVIAASGSPSPELAAAVAAGRARLVVVHTDGELAELYREAAALLLPSRNEGFGLPALEAMACGCPVIAAGAGALPEVCGDAAELLSPDDPAAWRDAALRLLHDETRRRERIAAGLTRARQLTWERAARGLAEVYLECVRRSSASR